MQHSVYEAQAPLRALYGSQASLQLERQEPVGTLASVRIPA